MTLLNLQASPRRRSFTRNLLRRAPALIAGWWIGPCAMLGLMVWAGLLAATV